MVVIGSDLAGLLLLLFVLGLLVFILFLWQGQLDIEEVVLFLQSGHLFDHLFGQEWRGLIVRGRLIGGYFFGGSGSRFSEKRYVGDSCVCDWV